ncbi:hypothetical protein TVNIR_2306 [Thioalkalivibrio nitratireducens DSM 14787]|uniref:HMA domain-containing protein n=1 Tax=Thioalkalivibrio nitratireducens (strain DSM 14787 / UNIQEM 213 / ALEN2) TaxID=1255043 RepID=L0DY75_THIND|nr:hypothetical protein [Thioalkalivibrio nitratireducens]AGA33952.1 hypothetical protein TVNIR_2306 [Thioalkalivibrio nitratireducens DSM 14787]
MSNHVVDVTIHLDETLVAHSREGIEDRLRDLEGVVSATSRDHTPHLVLVGYDPEVINSRTILDTVTTTGVHAELVGM